MEEVEELLSATTKWSLGSSKSISNESLISSGADEKQQLSGGVSPQHVMSDSILELSSTTTAIQPTTPPPNFDLHNHQGDAPTNSPTKSSQKFFTILY